MKDTISHIWFDVAGTLYRETPSFNAVHDRFRIETYAKLKNIDDLSRAESEFLELYIQHGSNSAVFRSLGQSSDFWMKALDQLDLTKIIEPDIEVSRTMTALFEVIPVSIFTNFLRARTDELLQHLQIPANLFTHILTGEDVKERKPALDGFHRMIQITGIDPKNILYIGDREAVDIVPAKEVGMQTGIIYSRSTVADYTFDHFADIPKVLELV